MNMPITNRTVAALLLSMALLTGCGETEATVDGRWYSPSQVATGKALFADNCAECHGASAQGTQNWQTLGADGTYPPPPLNGLGHAWHHPLKGLKRSIQQGGVPLGGSMPGFAGQLSDADIEALISFFQSQWPTTTYQAWLDRGGLR
ncbi:c-type cytochrome [Amphritea sp.]|uniref:c-type cytochrome n=1 Tax=Amphritea sp. TaxID=1872502 RepID=UPI003A94DF86